MTVLAGIVLALSLLAPGSAPVVQTTLANGMRVVLVPDRLAPAVTTIVQYGVGSNDDTIPGIAHATEHMMFRGTSDVSAEQLADIAARAGATYEAETSYNDTLYYFTVPSMFVDIPLRLEADRMANATDTAQAWQTERGAIEQEVRAHESALAAGMQSEIGRAIYGDMPYADDPVGTIAGFDRMTASDIAAFYHAWYHPNNATLIVAGDIDPDRVLATVRSLFGSIPAQPLPSRPQIAFPALSPSTIDGSVVELPFPMVMFSYRFPSIGDPQFAAGQVLMAALDDGRSALHDLVVQQKALLALGIASGVSEGGTGALMLAGLPGMSSDSLVASLRSVVDGYRATGVPSSLVDAAKTSLLSQKLYRNDSIPGLAFAWSGALADGQNSPDDVYANIAAVTDDDVDAVLDRFVDPAHQITVVMEPKPFAAAPRRNRNALAEDVSYPVGVDQPIPPWARAILDRPLEPPAQRDEVVMHLENGLTLVVREETAAPVVVLKGSIRSNTDLNEPQGRDGVALITDALLGWGTTTYDRVAYQAQLDAIAATVNLGQDFSLQTGSENFDRGVALLADGMLHPAFPDADFDLVRGDSTRTLAATEREPDTIAALEQLDAMYPPGDPHRRHATAATIAAITLDDVRHWYAFAFRPDLTTIAIVGNVTPEEALATVDKYFGAWRATGPMPNFRYPIRAATHVAARSVTVPSATARQSYVRLTEALAVRRGEPGAAALRLANMILSGEVAASMLYRRVRTQEGYVYSIDSQLSIGRRSSRFSITFACDAQNVDKAQASALDVIEQLRRQLLPSSTLQRAKDAMLARSSLGEDSYDGLAERLLANAAGNWTPQDERASWVALLAVTPQQLRSAVRTWIVPAHFFRIIVAPQE